MKTSHVSGIQKLGIGPPEGTIFPGAGRIMPQDTLGDLIGVEFEIQQFQLMVGYRRRSRGRCP